MATSPCVITYSNAGICWLVRRLIRRISKKRPMFLLMVIVTKQWLYVILQDSSTAALFG